MLAGVWAILGGGALVFSACYGRNCEGAQFTYGLDAGEGEMLDENTWESNPVTGTWLTFPRQHSYVFSIPFGGRTPYDVTPYVSGQPVPTTGNWTIGSGNLTEQNWSPNQALIINDTCSDYYLRIVAKAAPFGPSDGGATPATTTAADASTDATVP